MHYSRRSTRTTPGVLGQLPHSRSRNPQLAIWQRAADPVGLAIAVIDTSASSSPVKAAQNAESLICRAFGLDTGVSVWLTPVSASHIC